MPGQPIKGLAMGPWHEREHARKARRRAQHNLPYADCSAAALAKITGEAKREENVSDRRAARHRGYYVVKSGLARKREAGWVGGDGTAHGDTAMTIELKPEHQQMIELAIRSGIYH